eukprot:2963371-Lingulodinium_polyedra.AAC.1
MMSHTGSHKTQGTADTKHTAAHSQVMYKEPWQHTVHDSHRSKAPSLGILPQAAKLLAQRTAILAAAWSLCLMLSSIGCLCPTGQEGISRCCCAA